MSLERVFTIPEVAALAGWKRQRMLRHLLKINSEIGGMLLHNVGSKAQPRYTITMRALRSIAPQWFIDAESLETRLSEIEERLAEHEKILKAQSSSMDAIVRAL